MEIFYREKAFHVGKTIRKNDFAPSEKYFSHAPSPMLIILLEKCLISSLSALELL